MFVRRCRCLLTCLKASAGRRGEFARDVLSIEPIDEPIESNRRIEQ